MCLYECTEDVAPCASYVNTPEYTCTHILNGMPRRAASPPVTAMYPPKPGVHVAYSSQVFIRSIAWGGITWLEIFLSEQCPIAYSVIHEVEKFDGGGHIPYKGRRMLSYPLPVQFCEHVHIHASMLSVFQHCNEWHLCTHDQHLGLARTQSTGFFEILPISGSTSFKCAFSQVLK